MASRTKIAAATAVLASSLFVGGPCASLAFAAPDQGAGGDSADAPSNGAPATATGQPSEPPTEATKTQATTPGGASGSAKKPIAQFGDGRNGLIVGETKTSPAPEPTSKHLKPESGAPSQTTPADSGEQSDGTGGPQFGSGSEAAEADEKNATGMSPTGMTTQPTTGPTTAPAGEPTVAAFADDTAKLADDAKNLTDPKDGEEEPQLPGWPFPYWWPIPDPGTQPTPSGGSNAGGGAVELPTGPSALPLMQLPFPLSSELPGDPFEPIIGAVNGLATAASELPFVPISLPVVVVPSLGAPGAPAGGGGGGAGGPGPVPRPNVTVPLPITGKSGGKTATSPPAQQKPSSLPAFYAGGQAAASPSYRSGYVDYLRAAGLGQVAAAAVPGLTGILVLTCAGGLLGYRQARVGRIVRASGPERFMG